MRTPKVVRSQAIADLLTQFTGEEECPLSEEIIGEVAVVELTSKKWTMRFDGSPTKASNGIGIVLSCKDEAYLTRLAKALSMGIKHMRVLEDSNLKV